MYSASLKLPHKISYSSTSPLHLKMSKSYSQQIKHVGGWWDQVACGYLLQTLLSWFQKNQPCLLSGVWREI